MNRSLLRGMLRPMEVRAAALAVLSAVALAASGAALAVKVSAPGPPTSAQNYFAAVACREASVPKGPARGAEEEIAVSVKWLRDLRNSGRPQLADLVTTIRLAGRAPNEGKQMIKALKDVVSVCKALHQRTG